MKIKLDKGAFMPIRAHATDAGLDIRSLRDYKLSAKESIIVRTGVHVEIPKGCAGLLVSKSGLNVKNGITSTGLIDEGFTGEILVKLYNHGFRNYRINAGDKVSQLVIIPIRYEEVEIVDEISGDERGDNGYGSTGK